GTGQRDAPFKRARLASRCGAACVISVEKLQKMAIKYDQKRHFLTEKISGRDLNCACAKAAAFVRVPVWAL
ncbi:MAG TPA: hypothetical protein PLS69_03545, partial [Terricaulis sp.]|nr:hypothetical protein [Terricaulis sp.]